MIVQVSDTTPNARQGYLKWCTQYPGSRFRQIVLLTGLVKIAEYKIEDIVEATHLSSA